MENICIRNLKREDVGALLVLITELADFEKMKHEVKITAEDLERDAFNLEQPLYKCMVTENLETHEIIGYALFFNTYSTWLGQALHLEDLYVQPEYRGRGIGKQMFMNVAKVAYENCCRLDFEVLKWNPAMEFYKKLGAVNLTETELWQKMRLDKEALKKIINANITVNN